MDNFWYIIIENYRCPIKNQVELTRKEEPNENLAPFFMPEILHLYLNEGHARARMRTQTRACKLTICYSIKLFIIGAKFTIYFGLKF